MKISKTGLKLIIGYESLQLDPYVCPAGKLTVGYGHVVLPGENFDGGINVEQAQELLRKDVEESEEYVNRLVKVELPQLAFDALVSFTFNVGGNAFGSSTLLKLLNTRDYRAAALQFCHWDNSNRKEINGLEARRDEEALLFVAGCVKDGFIDL